jgi:hypothetical protein
MKSSTKLLLGLACTAAAVPAAAQTDPRMNSYNWKYDARLNVPVKMYQYFPDKCRPALARAVTTYNAAGSRLVFAHSPTTTTTLNLEGSQNNSDLIVSYGSTVNPDAAAEAPPVRSTRSTSTVYGPGFLVSDTDVIVNFNLLFYQPSDTNSAGAFFCPTAAGAATPADKLDFETTILHEITHGAGLAHFSSTACTMYYRGEWGTLGQKRSYCATERDQLRLLYGVR